MPATFGPVTPILRIFDEQKARDFHADFFGFKVEFEHRSGENFPLYPGLSLSNWRLHLTEHHGDVCPGASVRIQTDDIDAVADTLGRQDYRYANPGRPEQMPWGSRELCVADPFGNKLTFFQEA